MNEEKLAEGLTDAEVWHGAWTPAHSLAQCVIEVRRVHEQLWARATADLAARIAELSPEDRAYVAESLRLSLPVEPLIAAACSPKKRKRKKKPGR